MTDTEHFVPSMRVVLTMAVAALLLSGCGGKVPSRPASAPAPVPQAAASAPASRLSAGMEAADTASRAVDQINTQSDAAIDDSQ